MFGAFDSSNAVIILRVGEALCKFDYRYNWHINSQRQHYNDERSENSAWELWPFEKMPKRQPGSRIPRGKGTIQGKMACATSHVTSSQQT